MAISRRRLDQFGMRPHRFDAAVVNDDNAVSPTHSRQARRQKQLRAFADNPVVGVVQQRLRVLVERLRRLFDN